MLIKAGVSIAQLSREIRRAVGIVDEVFSEHRVELVITSTNEGNHSARSLHYGDDAFDCRYPWRSEEKTVLNEIKIRVGNDFDVLLERNHLHIEYDPK